MPQLAAIAAVPAPEGEAARQYRLEIVAASTSANALTIAEKLHAIIQKPVYIVPADGRWHVQIGGFSSLTEAEDALNVLSRKGLKNIRTIEISPLKNGSTGEGNYYGGSSGFSVPVNTIKTDIKIDGMLDENEWLTAPVLTNFVQSEPHDRAPVSERTEVRILQDDDNIYFAFMCYDKEPQNIKAFEMRRDAWLINDDYISVFLDTYHDHRNFYNFYVNPLGSVRDAIVTDGQHYNSDWDGIWQAKTSMNSQGWIAEIRIPFYTMRFKENGDGRWGANFLRHIRRKRERAYWIPISRDLGMYGAWQASRFGELTELHAQSGGLGLEVKPFLLGGADRQYRPVSTNGQANEGFDVRYSINQNLRADFSYNTDFAQVESDQERVNLTRFSLFFPEKREFFLENAGLFTTLGTATRGTRGSDILYFYSRTIGLEEGAAIPIVGAGRLSGRVGSYSIGVMNIQTQNKTFYNEDEALISVPDNNFTAVRLKKDIFQQSGIGIMAFNKQSASDAYNRLFAADAFLKLGSSFQMIGNAAKLFTHEKTKKNMAGEFALNFLKSSFSWRNSYLHIDPDFNPHMGYVRRLDIKQYRSSVFSTQWLNSRYIESIDFGGYGTYMTDTRNDFISYYTGGRMELMFSSGDALRVMSWYESEEIKEAFDVREAHVAPGTYNSLMREVEFMTDESRRLSAGIAVNQEDYWGGDLKGIQLSNGIRPIANVNLELFYNYNKIKHPTANFNTNVLSSRITYAFSTSCFAKSYVQWNEADKRISTNFLLNYRYRPGSDVYLVYNELRDAPEGEKQFDINNRVLLLKLTYWFRI